MTPLISVGLCAAVTIALAAVGARLLWRDWVALSAAEWDAHLTEACDLAADPDYDDFVAWADEMETG